MDHEPKPDPYAHLTPQQVEAIHELTIDIHAAGDGANDVPGEDAARALYGDATVQECMTAHLNDYPGLRERLNFDPETGKPWDTTRCRCDHCGYECDQDDLRPPPVAHLWERLDPGSVVPAGDCPRCGAFSYLVPEDHYDPQYHKMTREQRAAYLADQGHCPYCKSPDVEGTGETESDGDWHTNEIKCNACGAIWNDVYTITDVAGVQEPDKEKP